MNKKSFTLALFLIISIHIFLALFIPKNAEAIYTPIDPRLKIEPLEKITPKRIVVQPPTSYFSQKKQEFTITSTEWENEVTNKIAPIAEEFDSPIVSNYPDYYYMILKVPPEYYENITQELEELNYTFYEEEQPKLFLDKSVPLMEGRIPDWLGDLTGAGIRIAIIDTGIDDGHPDFIAPFGQPGSVIADWVDFTSESSGTPVDHHGHGTAVASIIAGSGDASSGKYTGVAPDARLLIAKAIDPSEGLDPVTNSVIWARVNNVDVISMSLGWSGTDVRCGGTDPFNGPFQRLFDEITNAVNAGIFVVVAAGNEGPAPSTIAFPACMDDAIAVGAVINEDTREILQLGSYDYWDQFAETVGFNTRIYVDGLAEQDFEALATGYDPTALSIGFVSSAGSQLLLNPFSSSTDLYPISCLSATGNELYGDLYSEDAVQNIQVTSTACEITVDDTIINDTMPGEHARKVGAICSDISTSVDWTGWLTSNNDVAQFISNACPSGEHPIACLTYSATTESENDYGDDNIISIYIGWDSSVDNYVCAVVADDTEGGFQHKRRVGVVCSDVETSTHWSVFERSTEDKAEFYSPSCPPNTYPIFCLTLSSTEDLGQYGEDDIVSIIIDDNRCKVMAADVVGGSEHKREVGVVCSETQPTIEWSNLEFRDEYVYDGSNSEVETFTSADCPAGKDPISCLTMTRIEGRDDGKYGEDHIEEITFDEENRCKIIADDTEGGFQHKRSVELISSETEPTIVWGGWEYRHRDSDYDGDNANTETFHSPECPAGKHPIACLTETAEEEDGGKYGEDDIIEITIEEENNRCRVVAVDSVPGPPWDPSAGDEHKRKVGVVCSDIATSVLWDYFWGMPVDVLEFGLEKCPDGKHAITCLTETADEEDEEKYGEDGILSMMVENNICKIYADDTEGEFHHKRKVGVVCSDSPTYSYKTLDWVYIYDDFSTFHSPPVPASIQIFAQGGWEGSYGWDPGESAKHDQFWTFDPTFSSGEYLHIEIGALPLINGRTEYDPTDSDSFYFKTWRSDYGNRDRVVIYSSRGPPRHNPTLTKPDIIAPAHLTCTARADDTFFGVLCDDDPINNNYHKMGGTSAAAPHIAGTIALLIEADPTATYNEILDALYDGAVRRDSYDPSAGYDRFAEGAGRVNAINSVAIILQYADLNDDNVVNILDYIIVGNAFGSTPGKPNWNPDADLNNDGKINVLDLGVVGMFFGNTY